jgi:hypothetical protein
MKPKYIFLLLLIFAKLCYSQEPDDLEQPSELKGMLKVAKAYFRSNPYQVHFSTFLNHLMHDPTLSHTTIEKRTDTSLFSLQGEYASHNPYGFKPDKVEIRLVEETVNLEDSVSKPDTLLFYQLLGYSYGEKGVAIVKHEFERFERKYDHYFVESEVSELKPKGEPIGLVMNYFTRLASFSPLAIGWIKLDELQAVFTVTFRMKVINNLATLPMSSHDNQ